ncbi:MFS transporter [Tsukamurella sp. 8F]|uniref:MFS transporter n=1 Tax=unclassified Tsukamurella TaxID=2633480 RepID=UPI0023B9AE46|nr:MULTISPECIES: MFS transporter [unclassified Tsukamurella]MDF0531109.1 MFS transporter [Tsukamurella sp. 8J]MDF0588355.1 MFS transporter [Tsukamurella sp. 8F]
MRKVWLLGFGAFAIGTDLFILGGILPALAASLSTTQAAAGQAVTVFAVVYAVATPVIAATTAHLPPRRVLVAALTVFTAANLGTAMSPTLSVLLATRGVAALGAAAFTPAAVGTATALVSAQHRGRAVAVVMSGLNGAIAVGVPAGTTLAQTFTWRAALLLVAAMGACAAVAIGAALGDPPAQESGAASLRVRVGLLAHPRILSVLAVTTFAVGAGITAYTYIADILHATVDVDGTVLTVLLVLYGIGAFVGSLASGVLTDHVGADATITGTLLLLLLTLLVVPLAGSVTVVAVIALVWGAAMVAFTPPQQHRLIAEAPDQPTVAVSLNSSALYLGEALGAGAGGIALGIGVGFVHLPWVAAALALVAIATHMLTTHRARTSGASTAAPQR